MLWEIAAAIPAFERVWQLFSRSSLIPFDPSQFQFHLLRAGSHSRIALLDHDGPQPIDRGRSLQAHRQPRAAARERSLLGGVGERKFRQTLLAGDEPAVGIQQYRNHADAA